MLKFIWHHIRFNPFVFSTIWVLTIILIINLAEANNIVGMILALVFLALWIYSHLDWEKLSRM